MELKYHIDNNNWDEIEKQITIKTVNTIITGYYYLINYCLVYRKFDLIKKILLLDEENYKKINYIYFCDILEENDYITILNLLKIVNDDGKKYILSINNEILNINKQSSIINYPIFYFMKADNKYINLLLDYESFINWDVEIDNKIALDIYLNLNYNKKDKETKKIFNILLNKSKNIIKNRTKSIFEECLKGYNKYYLDKIYNIDNNLINKNNIIIKTYNNNDLFKYLIDKGADYNVCINGTSILFESIKHNNIFILNQLLLKKNINCNIYDYNRNLPINTIFHLNTSYDFPFEIIKKILIKTDDMNFKNLFGNTVTHFLFNSNWSRYIEILKTKNTDIFIKNNLNIDPFNIFKSRIPFTDIKYQKEIDELLTILSISCINNFLNPNFNKNIDNNMLKNNKYKLLQVVKNNIKFFQDNNIEKALNNIKKAILKYKTSSIKLDYNIIIENIIQTKNIFIQRDFDIYIYLLYYLKKYNFKIPISSINLHEHLKQQTDNNTISEINKYIYNFNNTYPKLANFIIYYFDKLQYIVIPNYEHILLKITSNIIFILIKIINKNNEIDYNCIVIDNNKKIIIYFKHFYAQYNDLFLEKIIKTYFLSIFKQYNFINPFDLMSYNIYLKNNFNTDEIELGDYIFKNSSDSNYNYLNLIWIFWFLELYINNMNINIYILIDKSIDKIMHKYGSLIKYIRGYYNKLNIFLIKYLKKNNIMDDSIFKLNISEYERNVIFTKINKDLI